MYPLVVKQEPLAYTRICHFLLVSQDKMIAPEIFVVWTPTITMRGILYWFQAGEVRVSRWLSAMTVLDSAVYKEGIFACL